MTGRTHYLGLDYDLLQLDDAVQALIDAPLSPFTYLVTPNVDHVVRLHQARDTDERNLWDVYRQAKWRLCDSRILQALARLQGRRLSLVTGSDLTATLLDRLPTGRSVTLVGGSNELHLRLRIRYPHLRLWRQDASFGLRSDQAARRRVALAAANLQADYILLSVGSPQQEMIAAEIAAIKGARGIGLCVGAAAEFAVGLQKRAPHYLQRLSLEWAYRLATNPRRLAQRYLVEGPKIFVIAWKAARHAPRPSAEKSSD